MPESRGRLRRGIGRFRRRARIAIRPAREPHVRLPRVLVVMGSSESGRRAVIRRLPEALFLHVVRNPATELVDLMQGGSAPAPAEFALTWVSVVREWMQFGARRPDRYLVVARDPVVSQSEQGPKGGDALLLRLDVRPE